MPDPLLSEVEAYGIKFRPRQSMFKDVKEARRMFVKGINEILADTASSTLQEQISADRGKGMSAINSQGDAAAKLVDQNNPENIFGEEAASKWASLAFS